MRTTQRIGVACLFTLLSCIADFGPGCALAADLDKGKRIAQTRCSPCHVVLPNQHQELANSPPFEDIAGRNGFDAEMLAYLILSPHPRMNMMLSRGEADEIAAYIASLRR
jgi:mono/diheme cytochrome c family protein